MKTRKIIHAISSQKAHYSGRQILRKSVDKLTLWQTAKWVLSERHIKNCWSVKWTIQVWI